MLSQCWAIYGTADGGVTLTAWFAAHYEVLKDFAGPVVSLLALATSIWLAIAGFSTFERWKRQKIEERRIETAVKALAFVYKARFVFENIRSEMSFGYEWQDMPEFASDNEQKRSQRGPFYAVLKRLEAHKSFFEDAWELQAECTAVFGAVAEEAFMLMHRARREIEVSARMLVRDPYPQVPTEQNKKTWERFHADIWTGWAEVADCEDKVGKKLADFRARMEGLCRPIVDRHPTKSKHRIFRKRPIARD